ncbi:serine hydrolase domain-containing protein [Luteimonas sp. FCS-9]|uniref:serine hydrolase domain-containing protein n=1 Tax=Luteimonas sp. FCS-9 TaxID=1547516 RepID=UPI000AECA9BB|nr:serine hydrolase domain-containing protein [Luteimonas sp. FCS-9]
MRIRHWLVPLLALALLLPCAASADDALAPALRAQLETNRQRYGIAGQAVLVARNGQVLFRGVDGEADTDTHAPVTEATVFAGYSLAKLFASTLVMQLVERQTLDLDAPIGAQLRGLPARWQRIPLRDILDHTSGLPEYFDNRQGAGAAPDIAFPADARAVFASLAETPLQFAPGTETRYTQTNYLVLAALLAAHAGKPYPQLVDERILRPLALRHTWLGRAALPQHGVATGYIGRDGRLEAEPDLAWPDYALGHAALYTTLDDFACFLQAVTSGELVGKATLQRLWQPRTLPTGQRGWFAAGWEYGESGAYRQVGHDGGTRVRARVLFDGTLDARRLHHHLPDQRQRSQRLVADAGGQRPRHHRARPIPEGSPVGHADGLRAAGTGRRRRNRAGAIHPSRQSARRHRVRAHRQRHRLRHPRQPRHRTRNPRLRAEHRTLPGLGQCLGQPRRSACGQRRR